MTHLLINGMRVRFMIASGSTIIAISWSIYENLLLRPALRPAKSILRMFSGLELPTAGVIDVTITHPKTKKQVQSEIYVTDHDSPNLGMSICQELDLLRVMEHNICASEAVSPPVVERQLTEADVYARFGDLFDGNLGLMEGTVHLDIDPSYRPVQLPLRRMAIAVKDRVENELQ